jgi:MFS family permease
MAGGSRRAVAVLCGIQFVDVLGVTSGITALPAMLAGVSAPAAATPILATAYAMCFGGLLVLGARLGDRYGHRRVLLLGCTAFALVSLIGAGAQEVVQLVAARGLQGAAAAVSVPSALRLLLDTAPEPDDRRGALAAWSATGAAAGALGLLVGGVLTDVLGWRAVFWVNVPVGILLVVAVRLVIARSAPDPEQPRLDLPGAALLTGSVMALIVGASLAENPAGRIAGGLLVAAGVAAGAGFLAQQRRARAPLVPRAAFGSVNLRTGTVVSFVNTATTSSAGVLATLVLQRELGVSAVGAGLTLLPFSLGVIVGSAVTKPLGARLTPRRLAAAGLGGIGAGTLLLVLTYGSVAGILAGVSVAGIGLGVASVAGTAIGTDVAESLEGTASGVLNTGAQLGTALGVAALLLVADGAGTAVAWGVAAGMAAVTALSLGGRVRAGTATRDVAGHR